MLSTLPGSDAVFSCQTTTPATCYGPQQIRHAYGVDKLGRRLGMKALSFSFQRPLAWVGQPEYFRCAFYDDLREDGLEFAISSADQKSIQWVLS